MLPVELYRDLVSKSRKDTRQLAYLLEKHKLIPSSKAWMRNWETLCVIVGVLRPSPLQLDLSRSHSSLALALARTRSPARQVGRQSPVLQRRRALQGQAQLEREPGTRPAACERGARRPDVLSR
jgi:hypothetical protein